MDIRTKKKTKIRLRFAGLVLFLAFGVGCSFSGLRINRSFTLKEVNGRYFLLPPGTRYSPGSHETLAVPIVSARIGTKRISPAQCSIREPPFSLYPRPSKATRWIAEIPSPQAWEENRDVEIGSEFGTFAARLNELVRRGCLPPDGELSVTPLVVGSLAIPLSETLFYRYSYRLGGGIVDLAPGMRLRIRRAEFRTTSVGDQNLANYVGERMTLYEAKRDRNDGLVLKLTKVDVSSAEVSRLPAQDETEMSLPGQTAGMRFARLFFLTYFVSKGPKRVAILVGTHELSQMREATAAIENDPHIQCSKIVAREVSCVAFEGQVIVSPELTVNVNGRRTYVLLGSTVRDVIAQAHVQAQGAVLESLAVARLYGGKHVPVEFDRRDPTILKLPVLAGDRITWVENAPQH